MNRLELVQKLVRLGDIASSGPSTTEDQTGDMLKAVNYIDDAYSRIQNMYNDWRFLWGSATLNLTGGTALYAGATSLKRWPLAQLGGKSRIYYDNEPMEVRDWEDYIPDSTLSSGPPEYFVIRPDNQLLVVPTPDQAYTVTYDYYRNNHTLTANDDEPLIPSDFHMAIVGQALKMYANFESAEEAKVQALEILDEFMPALMADQLPRGASTYGAAEAAEIVIEVV